MSRPVYSTRFLATAGEPFGSVTYTVPAGLVAVVRDVAMYFVAGSGGYANLGVGDDEVPLIVTLSQAGAEVTAQWSGTQVVPAGEVIAAYSRGSVFCRCAVSGYLLSA